MILATALCFAMAAATPELPPGKGATIVQNQCSSCHALSVVTSKRASKPQWAQLVNLMITRGAQIADEDVQTVIDYLAANFNESSPPPAARANSGPKLINVNVITAKQLSFVFGLSAEQAEAVIEYRAQHGKIRNWATLTSLPGVPASKFKDKKNLITY